MPIAKSEFTLTVAVDGRQTQQETLPSGYDVVIHTGPKLVDLDVQGRSFGAFRLEPDGRHCSHHLDDIVGYVVFDNAPDRRSCVRTDQRVYVGASRYGDALEFARQGQSVFARGIGTLCRCGYRSY